MKVITLVDDKGGHYQFVFPEVLVHADMVEYMRALVFKSTNIVTELKSAGFFNPGSDFSMFGESESTDMKIHPSDEARFGLGQSVMFMPDEIAVKLWDTAKANKFGHEGPG